MRALGFEPKKEEIKKMIADIDKEGSGMNSMCIIKLACVYTVLHILFHLFFLPCFSQTLDRIGRV